MNRKKIQKLAKATFVALSAGIAASAATSAQAESLTGLVWQGNQIFTIDSATPGSTFTTGVSGLQGGDILSGIDYLGSTLYGLGSGGNLYTINATTGAASLVNHFGTLNGTYYGIDAQGLNPATGQIHVISDNDINLLLNPTTGAIISSTPTLNPSGVNIDAIAFNGSTMYVVDSVANTLGILNANGTVTSIGGMGYDVSGKNGFDISGVSGLAYFASAVSSSGTDANLYTVDLGTGFASLVGVIGNGNGLLVGGMTVTPVPEPTTCALALLGVGALALARRRK